MGERRADPSEPELSRRRFLLQMGSVASGAAAVGLLGGAGALLEPKGTTDNETINGVYEVAFANSGATSAWQNDKAGQPMSASAFPGPGYGAQGRIAELDLNVLVLYPDPAKVEAGMRGVVPPGFVAFNAKCTHLGCTTLWRNEQEGEKIAPASTFPYPVSHDFIVCPCHGSCYDHYQSCYDPYKRCQVISGPAPRPLEQLKMRIDDDIVKIEFSNYRYGGRTAQV